MKILVLGGDGYLGWPTAMHLANKGHEVVVVDNYSKRLICTQTNSEPLVIQPNLNARTLEFAVKFGEEISVEIGDLADYSFVERVFVEHEPDAVIHYGEQPSGPYSLIGQKEGEFTLVNNLKSTHNLLWAMVNHGRDVHLIKLGTMGEYGTPNIDIEEGWIDIEHKGRKDKLLFPRAAGSLYHTTKVLDTDLIWFFVRMFDLKVTDLMQGPVYGVYTAETEGDARADLCTTFFYDDIFGTVINRFVTQAIVGIPLTVYGKGDQTRGYLNIKDTLQCVNLVVDNPAKKGELKILNQITESFSVNRLAEWVVDAGKAYGLNVRVKNLPNPRREAEDHYYNVVHTGFVDLGLKPHLMSEDVLLGMLEYVDKHKYNIDNGKIMPRVTWHK